MKRLKADCHALSVDGQEVRAELEEKVELIQSLEEECQQLRQQIGKKQRMLGNYTFCKYVVYKMCVCVCVFLSEEKDILASDLCAEMKVRRREMTTYMLSV